MLSFGAVVLLALHERAEIERTMVLQARAVMSAVDAELDASLATLRVLSTAILLQKGDLKAFHDLARRAP